MDLKNPSAVFATVFRQLPDEVLVLYADIVSRYVKISAAAVYTPFLGSMTARFFPRARDDGTIPFTAAAAVRVQ